MEGEGADLYLRLHGGARPQPADDLTPYEQAQGSGSGRIREARHLGLLPTRRRPRLCDASAAEPADCVRGGAGHQLSNQLSHAAIDLVADAAHGLDVLSGRVLEVPVLVSLARIDRTRVATAHRDHHVGPPHRVGGERFWKLLADVDADLLHRLDHARIERARRLAASRADKDTTTGLLIHERRRHLAPTRV